MEITVPLYRMWKIVVIIMVVSWAWWLNLPSYRYVLDAFLLADYSRTHSLPRTKKDRSPENDKPNAVLPLDAPTPYKYYTSSPKVEPKSWLSSSHQKTDPKPLDNYQPGHSSISKREALQVSYCTDSSEISSGINVCEKSESWLSFNQDIQKSSRS